MTLLIVSVTLVLVVWAICSLAEAAIYAVRMPYIRQLEKANVKAGHILADLKTNVERPISAILIVNTVVAAAGASITGALASDVLGESRLWLFSAVFTVAALLLSEIAPKIIGVAHHRPIARILAEPLSLLVTALHPLIWLIQHASTPIKPRVPIAIAPEGEVQQLAEISAEEGSIMPYEAELVRNVLDLDKVTARDILTPVSVVKTLPDNLSLGELAQRDLEWNFSRIPIHDANDPQNWTGFVLSRDVLAAIARDQFNDALNSLSTPLHFVHDATPGHQLLSAFLKRRTHIFGVIATGSLTPIGIVTLEDVLESLIGAEIVDELDTVVDMQTLARQQRTE